MDKEDAALADEPLDQVPTGIQRQVKLHDWLLWKMPPMSMINGKSAKPVGTKLCGETSRSTTELDGVNSPPKNAVPSVFYPRRQRRSRRLAALSSSMQVITETFTNFCRL